MYIYITIYIYIYIYMCVYVDFAMEVLLMPYFPHAMNIRLNKNAFTS